MRLRRYVCADWRCGAKGVRLWRVHQVAIDESEFLCRTCAERDTDKKLKAGSDQIGYWIPAVPLVEPTVFEIVPENAFTGYSLTPQEDYDRWAALPDVPTKTSTRLEFKLQDLWVGAYWDTSATGWDLWVCLLPCLPIHVTHTKASTPEPQSEVEAINQHAAELNDEARQVLDYQDDNIFEQTLDELVARRDELDAQIKAMADLQFLEHN